MNEPDHQFQRFPGETLQPLTTIEPAAASTNALTLSDQLHTPPWQLESKLNTVNPLIDMTGA